MTVNHTTDSHFAQDLKFQGSTEAGKALRAEAKQHYAATAPKSITKALTGANNALRTLEAKIDAAQQAVRESDFNCTRHSRGEDAFKIDAAAYRDEFLQSAAQLKSRVDGDEGYLADVEAEVGSGAAPTLTRVRSTDPDFAIDNGDFNSAPQFAEDVDFSDIDARSAIRATGGHGTLVQERNEAVVVYEKLRQDLTGFGEDSLKVASQGVRDLNLTTRNLQATLVNQVQGAYSTDGRAPEARYVDQRVVQSLRDLSQADLTTAEGKTQLRETIRLADISTKQAKQAVYVESHLKLALFLKYAAYIERSYTGKSVSKRDEKIAAIANLLDIETILPTLVQNPENIGSLHRNPSTQVTLANNIVGNLSDELKATLNHQTDALIAKFEEEGYVTKKDEHKPFSKEVVRSSYKVSSKRKTSDNVGAEFRLAVSRLLDDEDSAIHDVVAVTPGEQIVDSLDGLLGQIDAAKAVAQEATQAFVAMKEQVKAEIDDAIRLVGTPADVPNGDDVTIAKKLGRLGHLVFNKAGKVQTQIDKKVRVREELKAHAESIGDRAFVPHKKTAAALAATKFREKFDGELQALYTQAENARKEINELADKKKFAEATVKETQRLLNRQDAAAGTAGTLLHARLRDEQAVVARIDSDYKHAQSRGLQANAMIREYQAEIDRLANATAEVFDAHHQLVNAVTALHTAAANGEIGTEDVDAFSRNIETLLLGDDLVSAELAQSIRAQLAQAKAEVVSQLKVRLGHEINERAAAAEATVNLEGRYVANFNDLVARAKGIKDHTVTSAKSTRDVAQGQLAEDDAQAVAALNAFKETAQTQFEREVSELEARNDASYQALTAQKDADLQSLQERYSAAVRKLNEDFDPVLPALEVAFNEKHGAQVDAVDRAEIAVIFAQDELDEANRENPTTRDAELELDARIGQLEDALIRASDVKGRLEEELFPARQKYEAEVKRLQGEFDASTARIDRDYAQEKSAIEAAYDAKVAQNNKALRSDVERVSVAHDQKVGTAETEFANAQAQRRELTNARIGVAYDRRDTTIKAQNTAVKVTQVIQDSFVDAASQTLTIRRLASRRITQLASQLTAAERSIQDDAEARRIVEAHAINPVIVREQQIQARAQNITDLVSAGFDITNKPQGEKADQARAVIASSIQNLAQELKDAGRNEVHIPLPYLIGSTLLAHHGFDLFEEFNDAQIASLILEAVGTLTANHEAYEALGHDLEMARGGVEGSAEAVQHAEADLEALGAQLAQATRDKARLERGAGYIVPKSPDYSSEDLDVLIPNQIGDTWAQQTTLSNHLILDGAILEPGSRLGRPVDDMDNTFKKVQLEELRNELRELLASDANARGRLLDGSANVQGKRAVVAGIQGRLDAKVESLGELEVESLESATNLQAFDEAHDGELTADQQEERQGLLEARGLAQAAAQQASQEKLEIEAELQEAQAELTQAERVATAHYEQLFNAKLAELDAKSQRDGMHVAAPAPDATIQNRIDAVEARIQAVTNAIANVRAARLRNEIANSGAQSAREHQHNETVSANQAEIERLEREMATKRAEIAEAKGDLIAAEDGADALRADLAIELRKKAHAYKLAFELFGVPLANRHARRLARN